MAEHDSKWTHNLCERCWFLDPASEVPGGRRVPPYRVNDDVGECCQCGSPTVSGIYVRREPEAFPHPGPMAGASL